jgi:hypothetical protein
MDKNIIDRLNKEQDENLKTIGFMIAKGEPTDTFLQSFQNFIGRSWNDIKGTEEEIPTDINALVQKVLSDSYKETSSDLSMCAKKVEYFNEQKKKIRAYIQEIRTKMEDHINQWEEQLNTIGDDAQLANIDLQNMLQKQQQTIQMLSNISKILHDTALAVIRKIG